MKLKIFERMSTAAWVKGYIYKDYLSRHFSKTTLTVNQNGPLKPKSTYDANPYNTRQHGNMKYQKKYGNNIRRYNRHK